MILYNVTTNIQETSHLQWLSWMQTKHINEVLATGKFTSARLVRVLNEEENNGFTYAVQYTCDSMETLQKYYQEDAPKLRHEMKSIFGESALAFRSELQVIEEFFQNN